MFKFEELENIHLEITNRCQASCPMCSRNYHGGAENPLIKNQDWTLEDFKNILTEEVLLQLKGFYFCGNFGDPIINDDLIEMIRYAVSVNKDLYIRVHTNGGARSKKWWEELAAAMPVTHLVIFAIDGLEDTHHLYRVGTTYQKVLENAQHFIKAGGTAEWCFLKFKHNEHQVEEAERRAKQLGFFQFTEKNSSRFIGEPKFPVLDKKEEIVYFLEPPTSSKLDFITKEVVKNYKEILAPSEIDCYIIHTKEIYIDAYREVFPCCFLASTPYNYSRETDLTAPIRAHMLEQYNDLKTTLGNVNALQVPVKQIINSSSWQTAWKDYWGEKKLITCARTCGKIKELPKPKDQFVKVIGLKNE